MQSSLLSVVPNSVVDRDGEPKLGTYRGELPAVDLDRLRGTNRPGWWQWKFRRKRWHYTVLVTDEVLVCQAVVHGGYVGQGFLYVVDLYEQRAVAETCLVGIPGVQAIINDRPSRGHRSAFRGAGARFALVRPDEGGAYEWSGRVHPLRQGHRAGLDLEAKIDPRGCAPALTVIAPVTGRGKVNVTQKWAGLSTEGRLRVGSRSYRLDDGLAGLDYTQGVLSSHTAWQWAMGMGRLHDGRRVGLNLVEGFNEGAGTGENALWIGDRLIPLGAAEFTFDPDRPERYWTIRTEDGVVDLFFEPYYVYRDHRRSKVLDLRFLQPAGRFEARLEFEGEVHDVTLFGVVEDQDVRW